MLTVNYNTLGLKSGEKLLDLGCGAGRHAFEAARRGAQVVGLDAGAEEVVSVRDTISAMFDAGELKPDARTGTIQGDALRLPFRDGTFDRVIVSEVLEHIPDDKNAIYELARVLKAGGTMAVTVPRFGPEAVNWSLSNDYHDVPGGHIRIYRRSAIISRLKKAGLLPFAQHHAHALHSPYWWLKCFVGLNRDSHFAVAAYHRLLVWDITKGPKVTRTTERLLNPILGKSLVIYLRKTS